MPNYDSIQGKSVDGLLKDLLDNRYNIETSTELIAVLQARNAEMLNLSIRGLSANIKAASDDSGKLGRRIAALTVALVAVGISQILATAWPYLAWWWHH